MDILSGLEALLVDVDGTLLEDGALVPGAAEAIRRLRARGVAIRFATNKTSQPRRVLAAELTALGLPAAAPDIFNAPRAARELLVSRGLLRCQMLVTPQLLEEFDGITPVEESPDAVVIGDLAEGFTFERLNEAFRSLLEGAPLVAISRNRYWRRDGRNVLDVGAYVAALEYATGASALLAGKPASGFYRGALRELGVDARDAAAVGDDLVSDVDGAQRVGLRGILVRTGKFREEDLTRTDIRPDLVVRSIADLG